MRIIAWVNGNSAPSYHRIIMPLMLMKNADVYITNNLKMEDFDKGCDIFIYNRVLPDHADAQIAELKAKYGFKICVDVDDYWELDKHHILYDEYQTSKFAEWQIRHIRDADVVLTTHSRLAEEILPFNNNVHVCPNAIPKQGQFDIEREPYYLTRFFWQGSVTHQADVAILSHPIASIGSRAGKVKMVMAGYEETEEAWYKMAQVYTADFKHQYKIIPGKKVTEYYSNYAEADICLVPLVKSRFNGFKSNLKILEAANLGLPVIASQVDPYLNLPLLYCKCGNDWIKHITRLLKSRKRQRDIGLQLKEYCDIHFDFNKINNERKQILEYETAKI
jgi:glycosyltransferase involved in cell wall biosynthesis